MNTCRRLTLAAIAIATLAGAPLGATAVTVDPKHYPLVTKTDPRFQSYNVEMVEVSGGRFWAPYPRDEGRKPGAASSASPANAAFAMFSKRRPLDLSNPRLRNLAQALGPAYLRVSGAWANSTYFDDRDGPAPASPPPGFQGVLTRSQWAGVVDFARATGWKLVVSFPVSAGTRDPKGAWVPDQARSLIRFTRSLGGEIYAAELVNEPNVGSLVGLPVDYDPARFASDVTTLRGLVRVEAPRMKIVGPGTTGEAGYVLFPPHKGMMTTAELMRAEPRPAFDIFSYHFYGTVSKRCSAMDRSAGIDPAQALTEAWLSRADTAFDYYARTQKEFAPGRPIWVTEIAEAACGGDSWAASFLDTFRYVDQMGRLARRGLDVQFHNTLAASDYALIDDESLEPRPSYWAALLWSRLIGGRVLDAGPNQGDLHLYAHCLKSGRGGVALVAINLGAASGRVMQLSGSAQVYALTAPVLRGGLIDLNGHRLQATAAGRVPTITGNLSLSGRIDLAPLSITFIALPRAGNRACRAT